MHVSPNGEPRCCHGSESRYSKRDAAQVRGTPVSGGEQTRQLLGRKSTAELPHRAQPAAARFAVTVLASAPRPPADSASSAIRWIL